MVNWTRGTIFFLIEATQKHSFVSFVGNSLLYSSVSPAHWYSQSTSDTYDPKQIYKEKIQSHIVRPESLEWKGTDQHNTAEK